MNTSCQLELPFGPSETQSMSRCRYCGLGFMIHIKPGPDPMYCSEKCRFRMSYAPRTACSICGGPKRAGHGQTCSDACKEARKVKRVEAAKVRPVVRHERVCNGCSVAFSAVGRYAKLCPACKPFGPKLALAEQGERPCGVCSALFLPGLHTAVNYCSPECSKEARRNRNMHSSAKRRASIRGAFVEKVEPAAIFVRDEWTCKACGEQVWRGDDPNHPRYPNLDHIIPLSKGGAHSASNCQLLCRECNSKKRNRLEVA